MAKTYKYYCETQSCKVKTPKKEHNEKPDKCPDCNKSDFDEKEVIAERNPERTKKIVGTISGLAVAGLAIGYFAFSGTECVPEGDGPPCVGLDGNPCPNDSLVWIPAPIPLPVDSTMIVYKNQQDSLLNVLTIKLEEEQRRKLDSIGAVYKDSLTEVAEQVRLLTETVKAWEQEKTKSTEKPGGSKSLTAADIAAINDILKKGQAKEEMDEIKKALADSQDSKRLMEALISVLLNNSKLTKTNSEQANAQRTIEIQQLILNTLMADLRGTLDLLDAEKGQKAKVDLINLHLLGINKRSPERAAELKASLVKLLGKKNLAEVAVKIPMKSDSNSFLTSNYNLDGYILSKQNDKSSIDVLKIDEDEDGNVHTVYVRPIE